jgi:predicted Zn-dependent protease
MPKVFQTLDRVSARAGGGRLPAWASTHPNPANRAERISSQIAGLSEEQRRGTVNRDGFLRRLQGMTFGANPREGYSVKNVFYHPELEFRLAFPAGWRIVNQRQYVAAISPKEDAVVVLSLVSQDTPAAAANEFFEGNEVESLGSWRRGFFDFRTVPKEQAQTLRGLVRFPSHQGRVYRLLSYTVDERWPTYEGAAQGTLVSFGRLTERRYLDVQPKRMELLELPRAMTLGELARRFPSTVDETTLAIINGVEIGEMLEAGRLVKRVTGGELPGG